MRQVRTIGFCILTSFSLAALFPTPSHAGSGSPDAADGPPGPAPLRPASNAQV